MANASSSSQQRRTRRRGLTGAALMSSLLLAVPMAFVGGTAVREQLLPRGSATCRHFFNLPVMNPQGVAKEAFIAETFNKIRPGFPAGYDINFMELEPTDGILWDFVCDNSQNLRFNYALAVGRKVLELDRFCMASMQTAAQSGRAKKFKPLPWVGKDWGKLPDSFMDVALVAEGGFTRLHTAGDLEPALRLLHKAVKPTGRVYFVSTQKDEQLVGCLDIGFEGDILKRNGFQVAACYRNYGVAVGCLAKTEKETPALKKLGEKKVPPKSGGGWLPKKA